MSAPRGLLLDFGGVISVSLFERHRDTERTLGLAPNSLTWLGGVAPETDSLWQAMQRDELSEREYYARRARELGEAVGESGWDMARLLQRIRQADAHSVVRPGMRRLIGAAHAGGVRVGILSNDLELFYGADFLARAGLRAQLAAVIDAEHTRVLKPDVRAYALALDALGLPAAQVLFVDDQFRNIVGAVRAGLQVEPFELRDVPGSIAAVAARLRLAAGE